MPKELVYKVYVDALKLSHGDIFSYGNAVHAPVHLHSSLSGSLKL